MLSKDNPWWLLFEGISVAKNCHTLHSCSGWESGLCLRGAAGLLRTSAAALQKGTEIGSTWSEGLAFCEHALVQAFPQLPLVLDVSPSAHGLLHHFWPRSGTQAHPFWLWLPNLEVCSCITRTQCWTLCRFVYLFVCCLFFVLFFAMPPFFSTRRLQRSESKHKEKGQVSYQHAVKLSLEVDHKRAGRALRI